MSINNIRGKVFTSFDGTLVTLVTEVNDKKKIVRLGDGRWWTFADFALYFNLED